MKSKLSSRSSNPPCPGRMLAASFASEPRFIALSAKSPKIPTTVIANRQRNRKFIRQFGEKRRRKRAPRKPSSKPSRRLRLPRFYPGEIFGVKFVFAEIFPDEIRARRPRPSATRKKKPSSFVERNGTSVSSNPTRIATRNPPRKAIYKTPRTVTPTPVSIFEKSF